MSAIHLLDEDLINKIAAGEVVERPASVVKEIVENSLDAQATKIDVEIQDSGKKLIKVSDNGEGMSKEDVLKSVLRHATSKIQSVEELFSITTLGFRGEALASIAAVSQLSITSKQKGKLEGFTMVLENGGIINSGIAAAEEGTTVEVRNLFFNTPARKKFLKTDAVELRHIIDVVINYALANPKVSFKLTHEGHTLLHSPAVADARSNIASIYGIQLAKELLEVQYQDEFVKINGFIAKPYQVRNDKTQQVLLVNKRWVKNNDITKAVYDGYHSMLFVNKHPVFVLNLDLDPQKIDVNVHPQKSEIKIEQKELVIKAVTTAVNQTLRKHNLIPVLDVEFEQQTSFGIPAQKKVEKPAYKYQFEKAQQTMFVREEALPLQEAEEDKEVYQEQEPVIIPEQEAAAERTETSAIPALKILGQVHKTFFVAETPGGMMCIDQHAAHERVLYEQFMKQYMNKQIEVQHLLQGEMMEFSPAEKILVMERKAELERYGFRLEEFGDNAFVLKTVPSLLGRIQPAEITYEIVNKLQQEKGSLQEIQEEIITRMACRAAVMAGEVLSIFQINAILDDLSLCQHPYTCPHGRPTMIKTSYEELEKKFKRK